MKKIAIVCLVLGIFAACKATDRLGVTEDSGTAAAEVTDAGSSMLTDPAEPLPAIYMSVPEAAVSAPSASVSASAMPVPAASK